MIKMNIPIVGTSGVSHRVIFSVSVHVAFQSTLPMFEHGAEV